MFYFARCAQSFQKVGYGVRSLFPLSPGDIVTGYAGVVSRHKGGAFTALLTLTMSKRIQRYYIDAEKRGNITRFINHSCSPNLIVQTMWVAEWRCPALVLRVGRAIKPNDELTMNYHNMLVSGTTTDLSLTCECHTGCKGHVYEQEK